MKPAPLLRLFLLAILLAAPLTATSWETVYGGAYSDNKSGTFRSVIFAENRFLAVGDDGLVATSPDGRTWTELAVRPTTHNLYEVHYGGGLYVAVGRDGVVFSSPDGASWTQRMPVDDVSLVSVAYNGSNLWVAGGVGGKLLTSPNGTSWTQRANMTGGMQVDGLAYANGLWVAAGSGGRIATSANGISWTLSATNTGGNNYACLYADGLFVVGGRDGLCYTSPNGIDWTRRITGQTDYLMGLARDGSHYVACGNADSGGCSQVLASPDTAVWMRDRTSDYSTLLGAASGTVEVGGEPLTVTVCVGTRKLIVYNTAPGIGEGRGCNVPPRITVTSPNGGEVYNWNDYATISWTSRNLFDPDSGEPLQVRIRFTADDGLDGYPWVLAEAVDNTGSYSGVVPSGIVSSQCRVMIQAVNASGLPSDISDGVFTVTGRQLTLTSPNGGEALAPGSVSPVTWGALGYTGLVRLVLYDGNAKVGQIAGGLSAGAGTYSWTVGQHSGGTAPAGANYRVRIVSNDGTLDDWSDAPFAIGLPTLTLMAPNGGESWITGSSHAITWTATAYTGLVRLVLYDGNAKVGQIAGGLSAGAGTYSWTVGQHQGGTAPAGANYRVRIVSNDGLLSDWSDAAFAITAVPALAVASPNGGENWTIGSSHAITWTATAYTGLVRLVLYDGNAKVGQIAGGLGAGAGTYSWTVGQHQGGTAPAGANYRVRIVSNDGLLSDWSDAALILTE